MALQSDAGVSLDGVFNQPQCNCRVQSTLSIYAPSLMAYTGLCMVRMHPVHQMQRNTFVDVPGIVSILIKP